MDYPKLANHFVGVAENRFRSYKRLGDKTFEQLSEEDFHISTGAANTNSIAQIIQHLSGNMKSRWTDFLTTDGEKEWRHRDTEFEIRDLKKIQLLKLWEEGWEKVFEALEKVNEDNLMNLIFIRSEEHTILEAILRQVAHYAMHVGQIVYQAKVIKGEEFKSLSIPLGESEDFRKKMLAERSNRFLIAVDFSDTSKNALEFAIEMAKDIKARIWVTHVLFPLLNPGTSLADERLKNQFELAKKRMSNFLSTIDSGEIQVEGKVEVGFVADQIIEEAVNKKIDFIILGNSGVGHGLISSFGSTSSEIAFKSSSKVLLIPPDYKYRSPKLLVLANDQSLLKKDQYSRAEKLSDKLNATLELLHIGKEETSSVLDNLITTLKRPVKFILSSQSEKATLKALNEYADERNADWILMIPRERSVWRKILRPPGTSEVIGSTDRPLLVMR